MRHRSKKQAFTSSRVLEIAPGKQRCGPATPVKHSPRSPSVGIRIICRIESHERRRPENAMTDPRLRSYPALYSTPQLLHTLQALPMFSCSLELDLCWGIEITADSSDFAIWT